MRGALGSSEGRCGLTPCKAPWRAVSHALATVYHIYPPPPGLGCRKLYWSLSSLIWIW